MFGTADVVLLSRLAIPPRLRPVPGLRKGWVMSGEPRLTVLGAGYLGITHAACMASLGFDVLGVDTDAARVDQLNAGHLPIYEPGLEELLRAGLGAGRVRFTTSYPEAAAFGDVHFICTGTPQQPGSDRADLSQVHACVAALAPLLGRPCLVVGKSTVPVGTARRLAAELSQACPGAELAWGPAFLRAGLGYGGGCLPKDIRAFVARAEELGAGDSLAFLREVDAINLRRRARTADIAHELAGGNLTGVPVCVLGAAFKPGSDDVRDSPALDVAQILTGMGARVTVYDPAALDNARRARPELSYASTLAGAVRGAHVVLLLTEWPEFTALTPSSLGGIVARRNIIDARNALDPVPWRDAGWDYRALGVAEDTAAQARL